MSEDIFDFTERNGMAEESNDENKRPLPMDRNTELLKTNLDSLESLYHRRK